VKVRIIYYAEFKSALWEFVDDVEFYLHCKADALQVYSALNLEQIDLDGRKEAQL
jgi:uncharacterized protein (DUF1499 family)